MSGPSVWRISSGSSTKGFSDRLVLQRRVAGVLDLRIHLLARVRISPRTVGLLHPVVAACASEGIRRDTGVVSWLHWPDLVTIDGLQVARTWLSVASGPRSESSRIIMRIRVNCFTTSLSSFASALPPTSLEEALGVQVDLGLLQDKVLKAVDWYYAEWERGMHRKLADRIRPTVRWIGREVRVRQTQGPVLRGLAKGLDDFGSLLLERETRGRTTTLTLFPQQVDVVQVVG